MPVAVESGAVLPGHSAVTVAHASEPVAHVGRPRALVLVSSLFQIAAVGAQLAYLDSVLALQRLVALFFRKVFGRLQHVLELLLLQIQLEVHACQASSHPGLRLANLVFIRLGEGCVIDVTVVFLK